MLLMYTIINEQFDHHIPVLTNTRAKYGLRYDVLENVTSVADLSARVTGCGRDKLSVRSSCRAVVSDKRNTVPWGYRK